MFKIIRMVKSLIATIRNSSGDELAIDSNGSIQSVLYDENGDPVTIDDGAIHVHMASTLDTGNSSVTPLGASTTFTGTETNTLDYALIYGNVYSDQAGTFKVEMRVDASATWREEDSFEIEAGGNKTFSFQANKSYYRIIYINGPTPQTVFELETIAKRTNSKPSSHRITDAISGQDDATLQKSVLTALNELTQQFVNINATRYNNLKVSIAEYGDTPAIDAFARQRISEPFTIFDSKQLHDKQPLFWDESIGGSATSVHEPVNANVLMTVTANANDYVIRQTKQRFNYQPGKSQLFFMTFQGVEATGLVKRVGAFDGTGINNLTPNNGIYYESNNELSWNICKDGVIEENISQANWNVDKLDGTGASRITLDMTGSQILVMDMEWLGVGRVRVGFVIDGLIYYCHSFNHSNNPTFPTVYMSTPNLPLRYSIETDGANGSALRHICSTVISEGGIEKTGILRSTDTGSTHLNANSIGTIYAVIGIRLKQSYKDITVIPESIAMVSETNDDFRWAVSINPTVAGTFTYVDKINSAVQEVKGVTANTVSDEGTVIASGYASISTRSANAQLLTALKLGSTIAGVVDTLVLTVTPLSANADIQASLNYRELL